MNGSGFLSFFIKPCSHKGKVFSAPESISENMKKKKRLRFLSFLSDDGGEGNTGEMRSLGYKRKFIAAVSAGW